MTFNPAPAPEPPPLPSPAPLPASPILDYASPRNKRKLRLPSRSVLRVHTSPGYLIVRERLEARGQAYGAMGFAVFVLFCLGATAASDRHTVIPVSIMGLIEFFVLLLVLNDTFRQTLLEVWPDRLHLTFWSLARRTRHRWPASDLLDLSVLADSGTTNLSDPSGLGLLYFSFRDGSLIHLFDGHDARELQWLDHHLRSLLPPPPTDPTSPVASTFPMS